MLDIEIIKWGCQFAEEFELDFQDGRGFVRFGGILKGALIPIEDFNVKGSYVNTVYYPLLIQRVIEGINNKYAEDKDFYYCFHQEEESIDVYDLYYREITKIIYYDSHDSKGIDQAKEQAIEYIYKELNK